jgi:hypothetical protein
VIDFKKEQHFLKFLIERGPPDLREYVLDIIERGKYPIARETINRLIGQLDVKSVTRIAQMAHIDFRRNDPRLLSHYLISEAYKNPEEAIMMLELLDSYFDLIHNKDFIRSSINSKTLFEYLIKNHIDVLKPLKWKFIYSLFRLGDSPESVERLQLILNLGPFDTTNVRKEMEKLTTHRTTKLRAVIEDYFR